MELYGLSQAFTFEGSLAQPCSINLPAMSWSSYRAWTSVEAWRSAALAPLLTALIGHVHTDRDIERGRGSAINANGPHWRTRNIVGPD